MNLIKRIAYRFGMRLVRWSAGPRASSNLAYLSMEKHQYVHFRERAALRGMDMEQLPGHLLHLFVRESEAEIWKINFREDLFPNHK